MDPDQRCISYWRLEDGDIPASYVSFPEYTSWGSVVFGVFIHFFRVMILWFKHHRSRLFFRTASWGHKGNSTKIFSKWIRWRHTRKLLFFWKVVLPILSPWWPKTVWLQEIPLIARFFMLYSPIFLLMNLCRKFNFRNTQIFWGQTILKHTYGWYFQKPFRSGRW